MSWSKVKNPKEKPLKWWYHKILCEFGYWLRGKGLFTKGMRMYYKHLDKLCKIGWNLYGEKLKR